MRKDNSVSLVKALKDPRGRDYETEQLDEDGHTYIYRYIAEKGVFLRATLPSGAAAPIFRPLHEGDKVPIEGWVPIRERSLSRPRLVKS